MGCHRSLRSSRCSIRASNIQSETISVAVEDLTHVLCAPSIIEAVRGMRSETGHLPRQVRDWYVESFTELRSFPSMKVRTESSQVPISIWLLGGS